MEAKLFVDLLPESEDYFLDIHTAASIGCDERIRDILESYDRKQIVDDCNDKGWTPLMYAACCANLKVVLLLLEEGAKPDIKNYEGHTALILAAKCGSSDVVNLLIDNGASINDKDFKGWTALFHAIAFGHRSVMQLLIERGAFVDIIDDDERTPLMIAAASGNERIVQDLLQMGIDPNMVCKSGDTARSLAMKNGYMNVKHVIDLHLQSKRKTAGPNLQSPDLLSLLKELQLTKYYHIFESHGIDLSTFWLLTDDDLKEIGIQLLGPRKKICIAISQYQQQQSKKNLSKESVDNILTENKKLHQVIEKLKAMVLEEKNSKIAAERKVANAIENMINYDKIFQSTLGQVSDFLQKLKENQSNLKSLMCCTFQEINFNSNRGLKFKVDSIFQTLDCMQKLVEIQHQNITATQQRRNSLKKHK